MGAAEEKTVAGSVPQSDMDTERGDGPHLSATDVEDSAKDPNIVDFDGPDDPKNPLNWSSPKKGVSVALVSLITLLSPLASTISSPGVRETMAEFDSTDDVLGTLITTIFLLGYAFGPLVIAPVSELYGRDPVYKLCSVLFVVFAIACAVADSLDSLIAFRFFCGVMGSCPITLGPATIADIFPQEKRGKAMSACMMGPIIGPVIGPIAAGYLTESASWRWSFWLLAILMGAVTIPVFIFMRETNAAVILKRKAARLRKETGNQELRTALDTGVSPGQLFAKAIWRPLRMLALPVVFLNALYTAVIYAYLYLCFTTFPRIFEGGYGFSTSESGAATAGIGVGSLAGVVIAGGTSDRIVRVLSKRNGGEAKPEYRLPLLLFGSFLVPIGLFWYGWSAETRQHWIMPIIGTGFMGAGMIVSFMATMTYLVDAYTMYAASVMAATAVFRSLVGTFVPLVGNDMYDALGVGWGTSLLGFIAIAFIPLPFIFYRYGERFRGKVHFAP